MSQAGSNHDEASNQGSARRDCRPLVILSRGSRHGAAWADEISDLVRPFASQVLMPSGKDNFDAALNKALADGVEEVWVGGGDGSVRRAAEVFARSAVILGILPLGTGNALASELGIPEKPAEMVAMLRSEAVERRIDLGSFNGQVFVNVATLGLTTGIARALMDTNKKLLGKLAYLPAVVKAVGDMRKVQVEIETQGQVFRGNILQFVASNSGRHAGGFQVTPRARIDDGLLSVYAVRPTGTEPLLQYAWALARGKHTRLSEVWSVETTQLTVTTPRHCPFILDGDIVHARRAEIQIMPLALRVLAAPADSL